MGRFTAARKPRIRAFQALDLSDKRPCDAIEQGQGSNLEADAKMDIRPAIEDDLTTIASIHATSWRDAYAGILPADYLRDQVQQDLEAYWKQREILPQDVVLVADTSDGPVGFIAVWCRPSPFIDNLHVLPSMRSRGIGAALMEAAAGRLIAQGHSTAHLWVFERNEAAIRFYQRLGAIKGGQEMKEVFGHKVPSLRLEWSDLGAIGTNSRPGMGPCS
jgi:ribosomal protein S18 acetylase RimI-like enzyme